MLTLPTDLFPSRQTGSVSGFSGTGAGIGGMAFTWLVGTMVDRFSYTPIFILAGLMPMVALLVVEWLIPPGFPQRQRAQRSVPWAKWRRTIAGS